MSYVLNLQGIENTPAEDGPASITSSFSLALCGSTLSLSVCFVAD